MENITRILPALSESESESESGSESLFSPQLAKNGKVSTGEVINQITDCVILELTLIKFISFIPMT
jgi:hypothetical protein